MTPSILSTAALNDSLNELTSEIDRHREVIERLESREAELVAAVMDLARICEAARYTAGLGKHQWEERVEKARALAGGRT